MSYAEGYAQGIKDGHAAMLAFVRDILHRSKPPEDQYENGVVDILKGLEIQLEAATEELKTMSPHEFPGAVFGEVSIPPTGDGSENHR